MQRTADNSTLIAEVAPPPPHTASPLAPESMPAGEVELAGEEVRGIAVHAAARILRVAQPGEVLVSTTVRDLLSGSGLEFADRGEFELRSLDGAPGVGGTGPLDLAGPPTCSPSCASS
jgi:hypothetical protein